MRKKEDSRVALVRGLGFGEGVIGVTAVEVDVRRLMISVLS